MSCDHTSCWGDCWTPAEQAFIARIEEFLVEWPEAAYGPAHIVLDDYNIETENIQWCLDNWDSTAGWRVEHADDELAATKAFLEEELNRREQGN